MKNRGGLKSGSVKRTARRYFIQPISGGFIFTLSLTPSAYAAPVDGTIISGTATINQATPDHTVIHQTTDKAIINWRDFNIGAG